MLRRAPNQWGKINGTDFVYPLSEMRKVSVSWSLPAILTAVRTFPTESSISASASPNGPRAVELRKNSPEKKERKVWRKNAGRKFLDLID